MRMGGGDGIDGKSGEAEDRRVDHDASGRQAGERGCGNTRRDSCDGKPDKHPTSVVLVGQPAHRKLRKCATGDKSGKEYRDLIKREANALAVNRADHAKGCGGKRSNNRASHGERRPSKSQHWTQPRRAWRGGLFARGQRHGQKCGTAQNGEQVVADISCWGQNADH